MATRASLQQGLIRYASRIGLACQRRHYRRAGDIIGLDFGVKRGRDGKDGKPAKETRKIHAVA